MSILDEFRSYLASIPAIADPTEGRISQEYAFELDPLPLVLYGRRGRESLLIGLDDSSGGPYRHSFSVEC
ncbi:unnamed protein product, partial [marine sediment metagenome]